MRKPEHLERRVEAIVLSPDAVTDRATQPLQPICQAEPVDESEELHIPVKEVVVILLHRGVADTVASGEAAEVGLLFQQEERTAQPQTAPQAGHSTTDDYDPIIIAHRSQTLT